MIDILSFNKSFKVNCIKKYLDIHNRGSWKTFFDLEFYQFVVTEYYMGICIKVTSQV